VGSQNPARAKPHAGLHASPHAALGSPRKSARGSGGPSAGPHASPDADSVPHQEPPRLKATRRKNLYSNFSMYISEEGRDG